MKAILRAARLAFLLLAGSLMLYLLWLPYVPRLKKENPDMTALIRLRQRQAKKQGKEFAPKMAWKGIDGIPGHVIQAVLLAEDDTFFQHHGFDLKQIQVALEVNWRKRRFAYGGSTITQQLARTLYLSPRKNLLRKAKEAVLTLWLEQALSKQRILELYLNTAEWGNGVFGVEAASLHYYGKTSALLTPEEAVALASILPSPRKWSPHRITPFMARRRANLLSRMAVPAAQPTPEQKAVERGEVEAEMPENREESIEPPSTDPLSPADLLPQPQRP